MLISKHLVLDDEMNEFDKTNEKYLPKTTNINGKERPIYNS